MQTKHTRTSVQSEAEVLKTPIDGSAPMPVVKPAAVPATVPRLSDHAALEQQLLELRQAVSGVAEFCGGNLLMKKTASRQDIDALQAMLPSLPALRKQWAASFDRLASAEEIALEAARLAGTMASAGTLDMRIFPSTLCEDITAMKPTLFELQRASATVRRTERYISIVDIAAQIKQQKARSKFTRKLLKQGEIEAVLKTAERDYEERLDPQKYFARMERERQAAWGKLKARFDGDIDKLVAAAAADNGLEIKISGFAFAEGVAEAHTVLDRIDDARGRHLQQRQREPDPYAGHRVFEDPPLLKRSPRDLRGQRR